LLLPFILLSGCGGEAPPVTTPVETSPELPPPDGSAPDKTIAYWVKELHEPEDSRGSSAAEQLAEIGKPAVPFLIDALKDPKIRPRAERALRLMGDSAVEGLAKAVGDPATIDLVLPLLRAKNPQAAAGELADLLKDRDAAVRLRALKTLREFKILPSYSAAGAIARLLTDRDPEVQSLALEMVGDIGAAPEDVPVLVGILIDRPVPDQVMIFRIIGKVGPGGRKALPKLIQSLKESMAKEVRAAAASAIGKVSTPGDAEPIAALRAALSDKEPTVQTEALIALGPLAKGTETATQLLPDVTTAAKSPSPAVHRAVADVLSEWRLPASIALLTELLKDPDQATRKKATAALEGLGKAGVPALIGALSSTDPAVRSEALRVIDKAGAEAVAQALPGLTELLKSPEAGERREAAEYAGKFGLPAAPIAPALAKLVADPDKKVAETAIVALGKIGKAGVPGLIQALKSKDEDLKEAAIHSLRNIGADAAEAAPALTEVLKAPKREMQYDAVRALGEIGPNDLAVAQAVAEFTKGSALGAEREACLGALARMNEAGATALVALLKLPNKSLAQQAVGTMGEIGRPAVKALIGVVSDGTHEAFIRERAATALGNIGDASAVNTLKAASDSADPRVSKAAKEALAKFR
jgi:HEAT repeat protein